VAGVAGSVLGIRPIITLKQGEIFPSGIGRSRKSTTGKCVDLLLNYLKENNDEIQRYSISLGYGYDYEEAVAYRDRALEILREKGYAIEDIPLYQIGAAISVHTGPYPLGFGIIEKAIL
jgi:fatty acid-binding protein DegV